MVWLEYEVGVLGPVEVTTTRAPSVRVAGLGGRLLLALAIDRGRTVDDDALVDRLWAADPPTHAMASVRNQVARLRRGFGPALIARDDRGYRLPSDTVGCDLDRFEDALDAAGRQRAAPDVGRRLADEALILVRGRPYAEVADELWAMPAVRAADDRIAAGEELWAAMAIVADPPGVDIARLRRAAAARPHREVRWVQLVESLMAAGLRTEALRAVAEARRALAEFGMTIGDGLLGLERRIIGADDAPRGGSTRVPARRDPIVGRDQDLADVMRTGSAVWVEGAPGVGKTRLLAEAADRFDPARVIVLYAACTRGQRAGAGALAAIAAAASELTAPHDGLRLPDWRAGASPDVWPSLVAERIVRLLQTASSEGEIVVLLDDVQWLDPAAVPAAVDAVTRTLTDVHWVLASRPVDADHAGAMLRGDLERAGVLRQVALGPLAAADVEELVRLVAPELDEHERSALAADVVAVTHGHPLDTAELVAQRGAPVGGGPTRLASIVLGALAALVPEARHMVELLTVAGGPVPVAVLAAALDQEPIVVLELAGRLATDGLVAPIVADTVDLRHELVRRIIDEQSTPAGSLARRLELARHLAGDRRYVVMLADQLLRGGVLLDASLAALVDGVVADAIERLLLDVEYRTAADLATRYLDGALEPTTDPCALTARLKAATALIAVGDMARGRSTLARLLEPARQCGDDQVLADALLAVGPMSTGSREQESVLADAEALVARLGPQDGSRRVQLACWVAHHALLTGDRLRAVRLLDVAAADPYGMAPSGQGLILGVRAQAETLVGPGPAAARRALDELRRFATEYGDLTADAAERLLAVREAWATGTLADVARVRDRIAEMAVRMPRPDLRWWPTALDAAIELAAGRVEAARIAVEAAARTGRELGVAAAAPTAMAQQLLLLLADGTFGATAAALAPLVASSGGAPTLLTAYGMACAEAGDLAAAGDVADRLAVDAHLLEGAGASWPQVAMCGSVLAAATGQVTLASNLWRPLERFRGTGLALHSVGYFGSADRCLGLLAVTLGDRARGEMLLCDAVAAERRAVPRCSSAWRAPTWRTCVRRTFVRYWAGGFQQPVLDVERTRSGPVRPTGRDGRAPGSPSWNAGGDGPAWSRQRQPFEADGVDAARRCGAVRRAALPLQLLVPRRRVAPRGAGHGSRPAGPRGAGDHRPRRLLRRRALRRGGPGGRHADGVRHRDHADARPLRRSSR